MSVKTAIVLGVLLALLGGAVLVYGQRDGGADGGGGDWRERITGLDLGPAPIDAQRLSVHPASCRRDTTRLSLQNGASCRVVIPGVSGWLTVRSAELCLTEGGPVSLKLTGSGQILPSALEAEGEAQDGCLATGSVYLGPGSSPSTVTLQCRGARCLVELRSD